MLTPSRRFAGSAHVLRFVGGLVYQAVPGATAQIVNGEVFPNPVLPNTRVVVRFALADMNDLAVTELRLPPSVYDQAQQDFPQPGGPGLGAPSGLPWMQNVRARAQALDDPSAPEVLRIDTLVPECWIDGPAGSGRGLEQNTGVPVVGLGFWFTAAGVAALAAAGAQVVIDFEIPHSFLR